MTERPPLERERLEPLLALGQRVRARMGGRITLVLMALCFGQAALMAAHATGLLDVPSLRAIDHLPWLAAACVVAGALVFFARRRFLQAYGDRTTQVLTLLIAVIVGLAVPKSNVEHAFPQIVWVPSLIAAASCELAWIYLAPVPTFALLLARHGVTPAMQSATTWVNAAVIAALIGAVRWLHDAGLREALEAHERMLFAMFHDPLTGLPNRHRFAESLVAARSPAGESVRALSVLRIDLERFGSLTDSLGRAAGDAVLKDVAEVLRSRARAGDVVARVGSDDFLVMLHGLASRDAAEAMAADLARTLEAPRTIDGATVHLTARVGVTHLESSEGLDPEEILQRAEQAVLHAKRAGRRRVASVVDRSRGLANARAFQLSQDLHGAVERGELTVAYQPIVCLRSGRIVKAEALVRWTHPGLGTVSPGEFIPIAESNGTIHAIGDFVFRAAVRQVLAWRARGAAGFQVSINRSPVEFRDDAEGQHPCLRMLDECTAPGDSVVLEITEGVLLDADHGTKERLAELRAAGVELSLDDFGTGYSSIGQLHTFEMDVVKIDRRFVAGLAPNSKEWVLCESIIRMAHSLGLEVVAEGIETAEQRDLLVALGCDFGQGYFLGRPMPATDLEHLLDRTG